MTTNLLFADDDCERDLKPLARILRSEARFHVTTAVTYIDALAKFKEADGTPSSTIHSVLLDIILPYDRDGRGALRSYLGMKLANEAAGHGSTAVAFLTVVRFDEVADKFVELSNAHVGRANFRFFDKTELLNGSQLDDLIRFLAHGDHQQ
jgi:hypothetical protein